MSETDATSIDEQNIANGDVDGADELAPGTELLHGQYKITAFLNAGGFGITYRAKDSLERPVVIKECFPGAFCRRSRAIVQARSRAHKTEFASIVRHFVEEARSLSKLQHPNIVGVHQVFEENDTAYMALDFVEGRDLLDILEDEDAQGILTPDQIESILRAVLDAIGFVHAQDMLHRDISPDNILLRPDLTPVLIDFGAARQQAKADNKVLSALRVVKDGYSPQEFYVTGSEQGPYSDLYALGASFYHLISNDAPPDSQTRLSAIATGEGDPYLPLTGRISGFPKPVLESIDRAMAVLPKDRVQSAAEWLAIMDGNAAAAPKPAAINAANSTDAPAKGKAGLMVGVAVVALAAAGFGAYSTGMIGGSGDIANSSEVSTPVETVAVTVPETSQPEAETQAAEAESAEALVEQAIAAAEAEQREAETADVNAVAAVESSALPVPRPHQDGDGEASLEIPAIVVEAFVPNTPEPVEENVAEVTEVSVPPAEEAEVTEVAVVLPKMETPTIAADTDLIALAAREIDLASREALVGDILPSAPDGIQSFDKAIDGLGQLVALPSLPGTPEIGEEGAGSEIASLAGFAPLTAPPTLAESVTDIRLQTRDSGITPAGWTTAIELQAPEFGAEIVVPVSAVAEPVSEPAPSEDLVQVGSSVLLPFDDLRVDQAGSLWIHTVDGNPVNSVQEFNTLTAVLYSLSALDELNVNIGIGPAGGPAVVEQSLSLPVAQDMLLQNGMSFRSTMEGGRWVTRVLDVPASANSDLSAGDEMFAYVPTGEAITERDSLSNLLIREISDGRTQHSFAVDRDGNRWLASLSYPARPSN